MEALAAEIGYPLFVKPVRAGSSFGVTRVPGAARLRAAVELALQYDRQVILEEPSRASKWAAPSWASTA